MERRQLSWQRRQGHPGSGPELLPIERVDEVVDHHLDACRRCGGLIRLLTSALTASLYRRIGHVLKPPGVLTRGGGIFPETGGTLTTARP
jgi:hypothetical protein